MNPISTLPVSVRNLFQARHPEIVINPGSSLNLVDAGSPSQDRLRHILMNPGPCPEGEGHGIIYVGGGRYWPGIAVGCKLIRELGCSIPIEVWYRGTCEQVDPSDVVGLGVDLIDADALAKKLGDNRVPSGNVRRGGWEAKGYAFTHTRLAKWIYLDADAYCVSSPCNLFSLLDSRPFVFWEDLSNQKTSINWQRILPEASEVGSSLPPVQGGQLIMDRAKAWPLIAVMHHMCQNSDYYWSNPFDAANRLMFGDQDAWRVGLASGACGWLNLGRAKWDTVAFVCEFAGKARIVHRCQSKLFHPEVADMDTRQAKPHYTLPLEGHVFDLFAAIATKKQTAETAFNAVYRKGLWSDRSGVGSSAVEADPYLQTINDMIKAHRWKSCVDIGCGDFRVGKEIAIESYIGVDVVSSIGECIAGTVVGNDSYFMAADAYKELETLPSADVLLCKDVLHHWPTTWVVDWLNRLKGMIKAGHWKTAVLTQDINQHHNGADCHIGGYRALNPDMMPLSQFDLMKYKKFLHKGILIMS